MHEAGAFCQKTSKLLELLISLLNGIHQKSGLGLLHSSIIMPVKCLPCNIYSNITCDMHCKHEYNTIYCVDIHAVEHHISHKMSITLHCFHGFPQPNVYKFFNGAVHNTTLYIVSHTLYRQKHGNQIKILLSLCVLSDMAVK